MLLKTPFLTLCLMAAITLNGQEIVTNLYGFSLRQYREAAANEFGRPLINEVFDDGFQMEAYIIKPDTSLYITFEFSPEQTDIIWSIQLSGTDTITDTGLKGLKLGMDTTKILALAGEPILKEDVGEYGFRWDYGSNYSFEINLQGKLYSIKIKNDYLALKPDFSKIPTFSSIAKTLLTGDNAAIAAILAPDMEIYYQDEALFFNKSLKTEIATDYSKIFKTIRSIAKGLDKIDTNNLDVYEENMRITLNEDAKHVMKIKTGHIIHEIVLKYINGRYLIWEIKS